MALSVDFKEWFRKSVFSTSNGGFDRFSKLVKRLEAMEAGRTVRAKRPAQHGQHKICPPCEGTGDDKNAYGFKNGNKCAVCKGSGKLRA